MNIFHLIHVFILYTSKYQQHFDRVMLQVNMIGTIHLPNQFQYFLQTNLGKSDATRWTESLNRDLLAFLGEKWEFDPIIDVSNPFPDNNGSVHIWQGCEDRVVALEFNRFIAGKLPWIQYHEISLIDFYFNWLNLNFSP